MVICIFPLSTDIENSQASDDVAISNSIYNNNTLKVKADTYYKVTIKVKVKVRYKVKKKVKVRYKKRGKWRTKYVKKYVYYYKYKYVYQTYYVRDIPPNECKVATRNCNSNDPAIVDKMSSLTKNITYTIANPDPAPEEPAVVEEPAEVSDPGPEPQENDSVYEGNTTKWQEDWDIWNESNTTYTNYLAANQTYTEYLQKLEEYQNYQPYITTTRQQTTMEKATNIFNFVRDNLDYSFYYNTLRGASNTLRDMKGNCCDHAHLVVALARAAGIPARYVHGSCVFKSGNTYGHVWAQLYINGKWYNADATSYSNTLGTITNWYTSTYILKGIYSTLPF